MRACVSAVDLAVLSSRPSLRENHGRHHGPLHVSGARPGPSGRGLFLPCGTPQRLRNVSAAAYPSPSSDNPYGKMHFPADALGGDTPEGKAAKSLTTLLTYVAVRVVMEQMSGSRHRSPMFNRLRDYINEEAPLREGKEWLETLMRHPDNEMRLIALRVIETRELYMDTVFDWKDLREATEIKLKQDNGQLKKQWMVECLNASGDEGDEPGGWDFGDDLPRK